MSRLPPVLLTLLLLLTLITASSAVPVAGEVIGFPAPVIAVDGGWTSVSVEGLEAPILPGMPRLPVLSLLLPPGTPVELADPMDMGTWPPIHRSTAVSNGDETVPVDTATVEAVERVGDYVRDGEGMTVVNVRPVVQTEEGRLLYHPWVRVGEEVEQRAEQLFPVPGELTVEYVVITSEELAPCFAPLVDHKLGREGPVRGARVVTVEDILEDPRFWGSGHAGTGNDTPTKVRNFISWAHGEWGTVFFLLGGDETVIPPRKVSVRVEYLHESIPTDVYYSGLDGDWDSDGDGVYGEAGEGWDEADLLSEVLVGRAPVSTAEGAANFVAKTIAYASCTVDHTVLVGERLQSNPLIWGGDLMDSLYSDRFPAGYPVDRLYERDGSFSPSSLHVAVDNGTRLVNHVGHGGVDDWAGMSPQDVRSMDNQRPFVLYSQACLIGGYDRGDSIVEALIDGEGGAAAALVNTRYGWYDPETEGSLSQAYHLEFFSSVFEHGWTGLGEALAHSREALIPQIGDPCMRWTYLAMNLFGDPEMTISAEGEGVEVTDVSCPGAMVGEGCPVSALLRNGDAAVNATVDLLVDGTTMNSTSLLLPPGITEVTMGWTPGEMGSHELTVRCDAEGDGDPWDDALSTTVTVGLRVLGDLSVDDLEVDGRVLVEGDLTVDGDLCMLGSSSVVVNGTARFRGSVNGGSVLGAMGSYMDFEGCVVEGTEVASDGDLLASFTTMWDCAVRSSLSTSMESVSLHRSHLFLGGEVDISHLDLEGGGMLLSHARGNVSGVEAIDSTGVRVEESDSLALLDVRCTGCEHGLLVGNSTSLTLLRLELIGNQMDFGVDGSVVGHYRHDVSDCLLGDGELAYLVDRAGVELNRSQGRVSCVYLVNCSGAELVGMDLRGGLRGGAFISCSNVTVRNNVFSGNEVGLQIIDSVDVRVYHNDFLGNGVQAIDDSHSLFSLPYPGAGNHWDEHVSPDLMSGEAQDLPGSDGVVDSPYSSHGVTDPYPTVASLNLLESVPEASFSFDPTSPSSLEEISFQDLSRDLDGEIVSWHWDLGDGSISSLPSPVHVYPSFGSYVVELTVTDNRGLIDSCSRVVQVSNLAPSAAIGLPQAVAAGGPLQLRDLSRDLDGEIVSWHWDLGDGNVSDLPSPLHTYPAKGDYVITLTVTDDQGAVGRAETTLGLVNLAPVPGFSFTPEAPRSGEGITFQDLSRDLDGEIVSWHWELGDGSTSTLPSPVHTYSQEGVYKVVLRVTDDRGFPCEARRWLMVGNAPPEAVIGCQLEGNMAHLTDLSTDIDGTVDAREWTVGGETFRNGDLFHLLPAGITNVTLTVWDDDGASSTSCTELVMEGEASVSILCDGGVSTAAPTTLRCLPSGCSPLFTEWDMGDGTTLNGSEVTHPYASPGTYTVAMTAALIDGSALQATRELRVEGSPPEAVIGHSMPTPASISLRDLSTDADGEVTGREWTLDGVAFSASEEVDLGMDEGAHRITLVVTDDDGLSSTAILEVLAFLPRVEMSVERSDGLVVTLTNPCDGSVDYQVDVFQGDLVLHEELSVEANGKGTVVFDTDGKATIRVSSGGIPLEEAVVDDGEAPFPLWSSIALAGAVAAVLFMIWRRR